MPSAGLDYIRIEQGQYYQNLAVEHSRLMRAIEPAAYKAGSDAQQFGHSWFLDRPLIRTLT